MTKKFTHSPLESGDPNFRKLVKILHSQTFIMEPKESIESENNHYREINIFKRLNMHVKYDWESNDEMNMIGAEGQVNTSQNLKNTVLPKKRIFLMIRAQANHNVTGWTRFDHPSYDLVLTKKYTQLSN